MDKRPPAFTRRERDVLAALCRPALHAETFTEPASIREVADALGVSEAAVKQHFLHLYDKFELYEGEERRRVKLANLAVTAGLVSAAEFGAGLAGAAADGRPSDALAAGREAIRFRNWEKAYVQLSLADGAREPFEPADLVALGEAALWSGKHDKSIDARQRAHAAYLAAGDVRAAGAVALALVVNNVVRLNMAQASGWFARAKRELQDVPPCAELGYLAMTEALFALAGGDAEAGLERAEEAFRAGERHADNDLRALGLTFQGYALSQLGRVAEAAPFLDEAMASAVAGELGPLATGLVYCRTICACLETFDYRRAAEWTEAIGEVAGDACTAGFAGDCRVHRASLLVLRGEWAKGEDEARAASGESERFDLAHSGLALYEVGQVRLRSGDLDGADAAFRQALALGMDPQPGFALLQMARGDAAVAAASIAGAIQDTAPDSLRRARLLPAQVEIATALGDAATVRMASGELERIARAWPRPALRCAAESALGAAALLDGDAAAAVHWQRGATRRWLEVDAPYEAARARALLAKALAAAGDRASAALELEAALSSFERLGAQLDAARATAELEGLIPRAG